MAPTLDPAAAKQLGLAALDRGREETAIPVLERAAAADPQDAALWQILGLLHRGAQQTAEAITAFAHAAGLAPGDARIAHGHAHIVYEGGLPSQHLFERAHRLAPADLSIIQGLVGATLADEGPAAAIRRSERFVADHPLWLQGHWQLTRLRFANGEADRATESIAAALSDRPRDASLWHHWLFTLMKGEDHGGALAVIGQAKRALGSSPHLNGLEAACHSELGDLAAADGLFAAVPVAADVGMDLYRARHLLRAGRPEQAARIGERWIGVPSEHLLFPYLSVAWRMMGDDRWDGLEGSSRLVGTYDIRDQIPDFAGLVDHIRSLHNQGGQPLEQSLRGGTQTDGLLLSRIEPPIQALRAALVTAIERHIAQLPAATPGHPQTAARRDRPVRFSGSWSVRFDGSGHHARHVHPEGWFSSAFYLALPPSLGTDAEREGWLILGQPDALLRIDLAPLHVIKPEVGTLALFPSTMWHGTVPFAAGERLTMAFDVAQPPGA